MALFGELDDFLEHFDPIDFLAHILVFGVLGAILFYFLFRHAPADFTITVRRGRVECAGRVPSAMRPALAEFLTQDLGIRGDVQIRGSRRDGRLRVWFRGTLASGEQQRIRNFLLTRL